jgi:hypothetical protein
MDKTLDGKNPFYGDREFYSVKKIYFPEFDISFFVVGSVRLKNRVLYFDDAEANLHVLGSQGAIFVNYNNEVSYRL